MIAAFKPPFFTSSITRNRSDEPRNETAEGSCSVRDFRKHSAQLHKTREMGLEGAKSPVEYRPRTFKRPSHSHG